MIVPARDAESTITRTMAGLASQEGGVEFEVIVVDDGSVDATRAIVERSGVAVTVVTGGGEGPASARNRGVQASGGAKLAFVDADCEPTSRWLAAGVAALSRTDLVQGRVRPTEGAAVGPFDRTLWVEGDAGLFETANLFVSRELFERLGGFESWLVPARGIELGEDLWLGWRARRAGARTAFCADAVVHHAVFRRGPTGYIAERARLRYFPAIARRVPELRKTFFYRRRFLNRRSAAFDLAALATLAAAVWRRPLALAATGPYVRLLVNDARRHEGARAAPIVAANLAADLTGALALALGSARYRSLLL